MASTRMKERKVIGVDVLADDDRCAVLRIRSLVAAPERVLVSDHRGPPESVAHAAGCLAAHHGLTQVGVASWRLEHLPDVAAVPGAGSAGPHGASGMGGVERGRAPA